MPCDVKMQIHLAKETVDKTLATGVDESELTFENVINYIINLSKDERLALADQLRSALAISLKEEDVKKFNLISNTTISSLGTLYPKLLPLINSINLNPTYNFTLIASRKIMLNDTSYYGRTLDSNGNEVFFIQGFHGAERFLKYLMIKSNIDKIFLDKKTLISEYSNYLERLTTIAEHYKTTPKELLLKFLNDNKKYKSFTDSKGNVIVSLKIINEIFNKAGGEYDINQDKSDLYVSLEAAKLKHDNNFELKFNYNQFYTCLNNYFNTISNDSDFDIDTSMELPSKEYFNKLSEDDVNKFLHRLFIVDAKLYRAKFKFVKDRNENLAKTETKNVTKTEIENAWKKLRKVFKSQDLELPTYKKAQESKSKEEIIGFLNQAFADDERNILFSLNEDKEIVGKYVIAKENSKQLLISFPWSLLGGVYNFGYDSQYLWQPVKKEDDSTLDKDGMYKGMYLYEFYDPDTHSTHFAVSRNIISPSNKAITFNTLSGAKNEIEKQFNNAIINKLGMWKMKMEKGVLRKIELNETELKEDQLLTVLDLELDSINFKKLPTLFSDAFNGTLPIFYNSFDMIPNIEKLNTPEKAAYFIIDFYNKLKKVVSESKMTATPIKELIESNLEIAENIINTIDTAPVVNYRILKIIPGKAKQDKNGENKQRSLFAYVLKLHNGVNYVDISGKFNEGESVNTITVTSLNNAATYFNEYFNMNSQVEQEKDNDYTIKIPNFINVLTRHELETFNEERKLGLENKLNGIKAFVYEGRVIINSNVSDMSDLYHEMSHIFLGVLKVKYPKVYLEFMDKYSKDRYFDRKYSEMLILYNNFAEEDILEETVVSLIAELMFKKQHLFDGFDGKEVIDDFEVIFKTFPELAIDIEESDLEFTGFMLDLISKENSKIIRNMQISQLIKQSIDNEKITKNCQ